MHKARDLDFFSAGIAARRESVMAPVGFTIRVVVMVLGLLVTVSRAQDIIFPKEEFESCQLRSGRPGICRFIRSCPEVLQTLATQTPVHCGFVGREPLICCPPTTYFVLQFSLSIKVVLEPLIVLII
ncbi:serine protease Hayan-like [Penaeus indicus]|uniref:serine protease Hayan-like n=1 Tax=Penaeus indicus TaxID=29960 RepID=UPI00300CC31C